MTLTERLLGTTRRSKIFNIVATLVIVLLLLAVIIGPITPKPHGHHNAALQKSHLIAMAMHQYADAHGDHYPTGKSSTEVFQKLLDSKVVEDSSLFWFEGVENKKVAQSNILKPENVCFDVTASSELASNFFPQIPLVFLTGYKVEYVPSGKARLLPSTKVRYWTAVSFQEGITHIISQSSLTQEGPVVTSDGTILNFLPPTFPAQENRYQQLTPDGHWNVIQPSFFRNKLEELKWIFRQCFLPNLIHTIVTISLAAENLADYVANPALQKIEAFHYGNAYLCSWPSLSENNYSDQWLYLEAISLKAA